MTESSDRNKVLKILVIGPLPPPFVGTTISCQHLIDFLESREDVELRMLNTRGVRGEGLKGVLRFFLLLWRIVAYARQSDVITLHCSTTALHVMGCTALFASRVTRKPLVIRKFAGDDHRVTLGRFGRNAAEFALRHSEVYLAQTKQLVEQAQGRGITHVEWFPTSRPAPESIQESPSRSLSCRRFVYIGRVCEAKGMRFLAEAAGRLPSDVVIDLYGPWHDDLEHDVFDGCGNITYCGVLQPDEIIPTMRKYDASVLPTHYRGEGYPGAILESYFAGLPVIATRWQAIPEIVDDSVGILVEPKDADDLERAITRLVQDNALFQRLRANTRTKAKLFSAEHWGDHFVRVCKDLVTYGRKESRDNPSLKNI